VGEITAVDFGALLDWSTLTATDPGAEPDRYVVQLRPGANADAYAAAVQAQEPDFLTVTPNRAAQESTSDTINTLNGLMSVLVVVLAPIAAAMPLGVRTYHALMTQLAQQIGNRPPPSAFDVLHPTTLYPLGAVSLAIASPAPFSLPVEPPAAGPPRCCDRSEAACVPFHRMVRCQRGDWKINPASSSPRSGRRTTASGPRCRLDRTRSGAASSSRAFRVAATFSTWRQGRGSSRRSSCGGDSG
jgi:hypothetical protein